MRIFLRVSLFGAAFLMSAGSVSAQAPSPAASACPAPEPAVLEMSFEAFDAEETGWRRWGENGCEREGAAVIIEYRDRHVGRLDPSQTSLLDWHAGQLYAGAGDYGFAIDRFALVEAQAAEPVDLEYTKATIAFLRSDREALLAARERMMAIPEPVSFARAADRFVATYNLPRPKWPTNVDVVDSLIACFGWSYKKAYSCPASQGDDVRPQ